MQDNRQTWAHSLLRKVGNAECIWALLYSARLAHQGERREVTILVLQWSTAGMVHLQRHGQRPVSMHLRSTAESHAWCRWEAVKLQMWGGGGGAWAHQGLQSGKHRPPGPYREAQTTDRTCPFGGLRILPRCWGKALKLPGWTGCVRRPWIPVYQKPIVESCTSCWPRQDHICSCSSKALFPAGGKGRRGASLNPKRLAAWATAIAASLAAVPLLLAAAAKYCCWQWCYDCCSCY